MAGVAPLSTIKVFALGGLDKKSNDLTRSPEKASDMLNMEYDVQSSLKKRNGFELFKNISCNDFVYYSYRDEFLLFTNGSANVVVLKKDGTTRTLPLPSGISSLSNISISYTENQNNLYFTNTDEISYVMKYDGSNIYRAGLPAPRLANDAVPTYTGTGAGYCRMWYSYKDINANITFSPHYQISNLPLTVTTNTLKTDLTCGENGFFGGYLLYSGLAGIGSTTITSASNTLTNVSTNYSAGDLVLIDTENKTLSISPSTKQYLILKVLSYNSGTSTLTFDPTSFTQDDGITYSFTITRSASTPANPIPIDTRTKIYFATSSSPDIGYYTNFATFYVNNSLSTQTFNLTTLASDTFLGDIRSSIPVLFEDIYDSTTSKIMPPICKYIASYGNQIVYGGLSSYFDFNNRKTKYSINCLITYSDTSNGDGPEGVSTVNDEKIGETWDGLITGMKRCNDSLVVFKERGVFSLDGVLNPGEYNLRKINTNFVGCTSHKSILESDDGLYFQGHNGIYFTNAIGVKKLTYEIDSVVNSADYNTTRSVRLKKKQKALFCVPQLSKIIVLDYYYNQIYFWDSIAATSGFVEDKNGDVFFSNGTNIYKFNDSYSDAGNAINSLYSTTWHHAGEPSLNKKWLSMRVFALTSDAFTANIKTEGNWDTTQLTTNTMQFLSSDQTKFLMLDMQTKRSLRVTFSNNALNENLAITGYELTFEKFNDVDKN